MHPSIMSQSGIFVSTVCNLKCCPPWYIQLHKILRSILWSFPVFPYTHAQSIAKFKKKMKELTCRSWGVSNSYKVEKLNQLIRGWINYFKIGSMKMLCKELDSRIRYRFYVRFCLVLLCPWIKVESKAKIF